MSSRIERIASHVSPAAAAEVETLLPHETTAKGTSQTAVFGKIGSKNASDVVIVAAARTATCKAKKGAFKDTSPDDMLKAVLEEVVKRAGVPASVVQDTVVGNVQMIGSYVTPGRAAQLRAGYPSECAFRTVNRQCGSGLQAIASIASEIAAGYIDCGVGAGVESMTNGGNPSDPSSLPPMNMSAIFEHPIAKDCLTAMGVTSENVAEKFGVSRQKQDQAAVDSHTKALRAQKEGWFKPEIVPVTVTVQDENGNEKTVVVAADEGPKPTTLETLAKLKPAFKPGGSTTAGNASQVSDGAAAVMLMRRSLAEELKVPILAVWRGFKVVGCPPDIMGIGPAVAIPALAADVGFKLEDVATYEINEAFASQFVYCAEKLGLDMNKVNPVGSGISLGHALGATGARQTTTLIYQMKRLKQNGKIGVISACIGGGQGLAACLEVL